MRSLFDDQEAPAPASAGADASSKPGTPLAERLRPRDLDEVVGHASVVGEEGFLRRAIAADRLPSLIFWGPPGCGKTTLARLVAEATASRYVPFSAVTSGIKEVKQVMADAARFRKADGRRTLLFVDEIHRFNRAQQDAFLPYVETGDIVLVGATTENPSFELNGALLSRCRVVVLEALAEAELLRLVDRALFDPERGLGEHGVQIDAEARARLIRVADGDARAALNLVELAVEDAASDGEAVVDAERLERVAQRRVFAHDKAGDRHYDLISALHKSVRSSDVDAAVYWLVRMLEAGEDPGFLARRLVRIASEDVGLASPGILGRTVAAWDAYDRLGSPEGDLALVQATIELALAPKSDAAYRAEKKARHLVRDRPADPVPKALRNAPTRLMEELGHGEGYEHAHDVPEGVSGMECLPPSVVGEVIYRPSRRGFEGELGRRLEEIRRLRREVRARGEDSGVAGRESESEPLDVG